MLALLLDETMEVFQPAASAKGIAMSVEVVGGSVLASFDRERVLQVLATLFGNAIKFTEPGGRITLRAEPSGADVRLTVADSGRGIAADLMVAIFEPFSEAERTDRRGFRLYIARCIVEAHGGRIWAESEPGEGSAFHFTLPGQPRAEAAAPARGSS